MLNRNAQYYEWLLPYLEGGLDEAQRAQMEARLHDDPALAAEAARLRRTVDGLRTAARQPRPASAQVPRDLWPRLRGQLEERSEPTPARPAQGWWLTGVGATAAATLLLAMLWLPGWHTPSLRDLSPQSTSPRTLVSPPPGPGRPAGPPPTTTAPPVATPRKAPTLPAPTGPKPTAFKKPEKTTAPTNAAVPPAPAVPPSPFSASDPFVSPAPPAGPLTVPRKPAPPRVGKPVTPPSSRSFEETASSQTITLGAPQAPPSPLPTPPTQDQPASAPLVAAVPAAPTLDHIANGAGTNNAGTNGQHETQLASPNVTGQAQVDSPAKSHGHLFAMIPLTTPQTAPPPGRRARQEKSAVKLNAQSSAINNVLQAQAMAGGGGFPGGGGFGGNAQGGMDAWQTTLSNAVQAPLWGDTLGEQQTTQTLMAAKESGELDELRVRLETRRSQSPKDLVTGRMLAAVYEFGFSKEAALHERRRVANLEGAVGEDWYALAQAEERSGSAEAARTAYRRALECPVPPSPYHAGIARARS